MSGRYSVRKHFVMYRVSLNLLLILLCVACALSFLQKYSSTYNCRKFGEYREKYVHRDVLKGYKNVGSNEEVEISTGQSVNMNIRNIIVN